MKKIVLKVLLIVAIPVVLWASPSSFILGWVHQFLDGYEDGEWSAFHDCTANPDMPCTNLEEGYVYWDEKPFWYQQGYEEGYKKEAIKIAIIYARR